MCDQSHEEVSKKSVKKGRREEEKKRRTGENETCDEV